MPLQLKILLKFLQIRSLPSIDHLHNLRQLEQQNKSLKNWDFILKMTSLKELVLKMKDWEDLMIKSNMTLFQTLQFNMFRNWFKRNFKLRNCQYQPKRELRTKSIFMWANDMKSKSLYLYWCKEQRLSEQEYGLEAYWLTKGYKTPLWFLRLSLH